MIQLDPYIKMLERDSVFNFAFIFSFICIITNLIFFFFKNKDKSNKKNEENETKKPTIIDAIGAIVLAAMLITIIGLMLLNKNSFNIIGILFIPVCVVALYKSLVEPAIKYLNTPFNYDYYSYGANILFFLYVVTYPGYEDWLASFKGEGSLQASVIIMSIIQIYIVFYCVILNSYFVLKSIASLNFKKFDNKAQNFIQNVYKNYLFGNKGFAYSLSNNYYAKNKQKKNWIILIFGIIIRFLIDTIKCVLLYIFTIILLITLPFSALFNFVLSILNKTSQTNENGVIFVISKFAIILTLFSEYCIIQKLNIFQDRIVSIFEFFATALLIPLMLDGIATFKNKALNK